jgi:hypothetical protein
MHHRLPAPAFQLRGVETRVLEHAPVVVIGNAVGARGPHHQRNGVGDQPIELSRIVEDGGVLLRRVYGGHRSPSRRL